MERLDKYLWAVRLFKTRTISSEFCKKGKVYINAIAAKSSTKVKAGDSITIKKKGITYRYKVKGIISKRIGAKLVPNFIENITSAEELEKFKMQQAMKKAYREKGAGRPTKKDRRDLDDFNENS